MSHTSFPLSGRIELSCRLGAGSLTVRAEDDRTEAEVTVTPLAAGSDVLARSVIELRGHRLVVHVPAEQGGSVLESFFGRLGSRDGVHIEIAVPSDTAMSIAAHSADITVHGRAGNLDVASGSSTVTLERVAGDLRVRGGSGDVRLGTVTGSAAFKGGSGRIEIDEAGSDLTVAMGSGELALGVARGAVRMRSGSGGAVLGAVEGDVDLTSGSGGFTIGLRPGQQAKLDVLTGNGRLNTEMPVEHAAQPTGRPITVRARTGSGDVTVRRAVAATG